MKWLSLLACVIFFYGAGAQSLQDITYGDATTLEIITWNLEDFPTKGNATVDSVSRIIQALDADVIALQEIWEEEDFNDLLEKLPEFDGFYDPFYLGGLAYIFKENTVEILDVYEIYSSFEYWNAFPRAPFIIEFLFNGNTFYCINNHLKCCGDGTLQTNDEDDEENRRFIAMNLVKDYIDAVLPNESVFMLGDLNDELDDPEQNNVFQKFINDSMNYRFADMEIANGSSSQWSYPSFPSHLDHILISDELFQAFEHENSSVATLQIDDFMLGGFNAYKNRISDHMPVALKLDASIISSIDIISPSVPVLSVYPNPTQGILQFSTSFDEQQYVVYDNVGRVASRGVLSGRVLDLTHKLTNGIYSIVFMGQQGELHANARFVVVD